MIPTGKMLRRREELPPELRKIANPFMGGRAKFLKKDCPKLLEDIPAEKPKSKEREIEIDGSEESIAKANTNQKNGLKNASLGEAFKKEDAS